MEYGVQEHRNETLKRDKGEGKKK